MTFATSEPATTVLSGFTVTGGDAEEGAGVYIDGADPALSELIIRDNACDADDSCAGVGLFASSSTLSLDQVVVRDNMATGGGASGGVVYGVGVYFKGVDATLQDVDLLDNQALPDVDHKATLSGGGAWMWWSNVVWSGGEVSGNLLHSSHHSSVVYGAGVFIYENCDVEGSHLAVLANKSLGVYASGAGGLVLVRSALDLSNCIVAGNQAGGDDSRHGLGGASSCREPTPSHSATATSVGNIEQGSFTYTVTHQRSTEAHAKAVGDVVVGGDRWLAARSETPKKRAPASQPRRRVVADVQSGPERTGSMRAR